MHRGFPAVFDPSKRREIYSVSALSGPISAPIMQISFAGPIGARTSMRQANPRTQPPKPLILQAFLHPIRDSPDSALFLSPHTVSHKSFIGL